LTFESATKPPASIISDCNAVERVAQIEPVQCPGILRDDRGL
jgi:hypothetical protein